MNIDEENQSIDQRIAAANNTRALDNLAHVIDSWIVPFIGKWRSVGLQPRPSPEEIDCICSFIDQFKANNISLPNGYNWLPDLLKRLSCSVRFNARNFVNIHPNPYIPSIAATVAVALQNPNNIVPSVSKATSQLEQESIAWLAQNIVGFDPTRATGNVVSGGTIANLTALLVARDYCYRKLARPRPFDIRGRGLGTQPNGVILATAGSHYSVKKAAWILGLGDENVVRIPVAFDETGFLRMQRDEQFLSGIRDPRWSDPLHESCKRDQQRGEEELQHFYNGNDEAFSLQPLDSEILKALYGCFVYGTPLIAYVFTVGTTDTGTIEKPDQEALRLLEEEDIYVHADAAIGGFAMFNEKIRDKVKGLNHVHSVAIDAHKLGHLAYPNGAIIFKDKGWVLEIMHEAPYLKDLAPTIEGSRPGTHVAALWAAIQDLALGGVYECWLERLFRFTDALLEAFRASDEFQILHSVDMTTIAVAPRQKIGETRAQLNELVKKIHNTIDKDTGENAYLVNIDRELAGVKVRNSNCFKGIAPLDKNDSLIDIQCLRIVVANPGIDPTDAPKLVEYLEEKLDEARHH